MGAVSLSWLSKNDIVVVSVLLAATAFLAALAVARPARATLVIGLVSVIGIAAFASAMLSLSVVAEIRAKDSN